MAESRNGGIAWHSPDPRAIIPLDAFHVSRSLRQRVRKGEFAVKVDTAFGDVIASCAAREDTWISDEIVRVYTALHEMGFAHSVESWKGAALAGGLYGVSIGGAFFGESMFSVETDASKVALVHLVRKLTLRGFALLDTQFVNDHIVQFGAVEISRSRYLRVLADAIRMDVTFGRDPDSL